MTLRSTVTTRLRLYTLWLNPTNFMCTEFAQHTRGFSTTKEFATCNQQDATFHNLFISVRFSTCFRRFFCPSSETHNCTYSVRYLSEKYCYLLLAWQSLQFWASDDGRKTRLKHVDRLTEINKLRNVNKNPSRCNSMQIFIYCKVTLHISGVTAPIIRSIKNCNHSLRYRSYYLYRYFPPTWPDPDQATLEGSRVTLQ